MSRINPIYISVLLIFALVLALFKLDDSKDELENSKNTYLKTEKLSLELSTLREIYGDKVKIKQSLEQILRQPALSTSSLKHSFKNSSFECSSESMNLSSINMLMSQILNKSYNITSLEIKKLSDTRASLMMEIKW